MAGLQAAITPVIEAAEVTTLPPTCFPRVRYQRTSGSPGRNPLPKRPGPRARIVHAVAPGADGREKGPEIAPLLAFIGRDRIIARLRGESA